MIVAVKSSSILSRSLRAVLFEFYAGSNQLKQSPFTGKHLCQILSFKVRSSQVCNFIEKETLSQVFSCEFCQILQNTFFTEHLWTTTLAQMFSCEVCKISKNTFSQNITGRLLLTRTKFFARFGFFCRRTIFQCDKFAVFLHMKIKNC